MGFGLEPKAMGREVPALVRTPGRGRFPLERAAACAGVVARRIEEMVFSPRPLASRAVSVAGGDFSSRPKKDRTRELVRSMNGLAT